MSIDAKPFPPSGGGASVPDASETVKGVIEIADSTESAAGTDDLKAMTPLKVKQRIDAALVGGVDYKGSYTGQSLVTAQQGDMYISAATYSLAGVQFLSGDHLIFNQDASDPVTSAMFDKIDNTDAVSSVNTLTGAVVLSADDLAADHSASNYIPANANIDGHLSGIDDEFFLKAPKASPILTGTPTAPTATQGDNSSRIATTAYVDLAVSGAGNQINDIVSQTGSSFTAQRNYVYKCGYGLGTQTITMPDASGSTKGDLIGFTSDIQAYSIELVSSDGVTNDLKNINNQTKGGTNGALAITVDRQISWFICDANQWLEANAALSTLATTGAYSDLTGAPTIPADLNDLTDVVITGTPASGELLEVNGSNQFVNVAKSTINLSEFNDDLGSTYQPLDDQLTDVAGLTPADGAFIVGDGANFVTEIGATARASLGALGAVVEDSTPQLGGPLDVNGQAITSASNGNITINPDGTGDISIGADMIPDADATHTIGDEDNRFISIYSDVNGALRFKAKNDEGAQITKGQVVYIKGLAGDGETPTVGLADADDASKMPAFGLAFNTANDQAEIQIVSVGNLYGLNTSAFSVGDTLYVDTTAGGLVNTKPTGETAQLQNIGRVIRSNNGAGVIMVGGAGRSAATPNLDDGKIFLGNASNQAVSTSLVTALGSIDVSALNDDGTYRLSTAGLNDVSDVSFTAGAGIDNYVLTYDNGTSSWGAEAVPSAAAASETVAGVIEIATNAEATAGTATDKALVPSNLSSVGTSQLNNNAGFISDISGESLNDLSDVSFTAGAGIDNYVLTYDNGTSSWGAEAAPTASAASETVAGVIEIATNAETATGTATDKALVPSNISSIDLSQANNTTSAFISGISGESLNDLSDVSFTAGAGIDNYVLTYDNGTSSWGAEAAPTASAASETVAGVIEIATNAEATAGTATDKALVPSNLSSVGTSQLNNNAGFISGISGESLNDLSDVSFTAGAGIDNYVLTYDNGTSSWGAEAAPTASAASETVAGVIEIATNAETATGTATDKALVPSNISSIDLSQANNTTSAFISGISGESLNDLSDVSFTAGAGIDNYVLTYDNGTSSWGAEPASGGGGTIPDVVIDGASGDVTAAFASSGTDGDNERVYLINNGSTARTVTLPAVSGNTGKKFQIKRLGTANVTIAVQTGEDLETTTNGTYVISDQYSSVTVVCNASGTLDGWYII
jgi:6,7-dimethyl-8-ribityllumazine synthase